MPQFLIRLKPTRVEMLRDSTPEEDRVVGEHFAGLQRLTAEGTVLMAGRTLHDDESSFGIVVLEAPTREAAKALMMADPAVRAGVFSAEIFSYRVALASQRIVPSD